jgi:hypothetical protein
VKADLKSKKSKDPAPGSYNVEDSIRKTQWTNKIFAISKSKTHNYVDDAVRVRRDVPGIGRYKEIEKGYQALSRPPTSLRRYR